jgi:hypothetical protein
MGERGGRGLCPTADTLIESARRLFVKRESLLDGAQRFLLKRNQAKKPVRTGQSGKKEARRCTRYSKSSTIYAN